MQPYLESLPNYIDGPPPWTPTNMGHEITSWPLKHDPEISPRDFKELHTDHIPIIFKQPSNIFIMHIHLKSTSFIFQVKPIPTPHTSSMNIEFWLISLPCHFHNQPFHVHYMPRIIQVCHPQLIHPPTHAYSFPSCHYIIIQSKYMPNIQE